jgi:hypothetical protein
MSATRVCELLVVQTVHLSERRGIGRKLALLLTAPGTEQS